MPKVSIIVPVYNAEKYLAECVESILGQTLQDIEVLLVDDGSTDASPAICDEYAEKDGRIKVFHKSNGGVSSARNEGLKHITGEYFAFVDSDDLVDANMYKDMYTQATEKQVPLVICSGYYYSSEACTTINDCTTEIYKLKQDDLMNQFLFGGKRGYAVLAISVCCKLYRTEKFRHIPFSETLRLAEDENYITYLSVECDEFCFVDRPYYYYRKNTESLTYKPFSEANCNVLQVLYDRESCYRTHNLPIPAAKAAKNFFEVYIYMCVKHEQYLEYLTKYLPYYKKLRRRYCKVLGVKTNIRYSVFELAPQVYRKWILKI